MSLARPWLLLLLLALPLWWWLRRRRETPAARYSDVTLPAQANRGRWWVRLPPILRAISLASARVHPAKLLQSGYRFEYPDLDAALRHVLGAEAHSSFTR